MSSIIRLMASVSVLSLTSVPIMAQDAPTTTTPAENTSQQTTQLDEIIVVGSTTRDRTLLTSSADVTVASIEELTRKAPKSLAESLELIPGIFVEGTAGNVSNNFSVRGLQGGGQRFVTIQDDGMPIVYGGGGDLFFSQDLYVERMEAVRGGSSGILTVNGAGATINFVPRTPSFGETEAETRFQASDYGLKRADFYFSKPIDDDLAFSVGGYLSSNPGVRNSSFNYATYHIKAMLEQKLDNDGYLRLTARMGDQHDAYYAPQPWQIDEGGKISSVPGLDWKYGNIGGSSFGNIEVPVSTNVESDGYRTFSLEKGIEAKTKQLRLDYYGQLTDQFNVFVKARYLDYTWDFNGIFPGSGVGNAGLTSAVDYLTPGVSPISSLLSQGQTAFAGTTRFGFRDLRSGRVIASNDTSTLNGLNGNGLMQQTWLNRDYQEGHDFGANIGARYESQGEAFDNSLTLGVMYYDTYKFQNQSAVAHVINDVSNNSRIYDVVALDNNNNVLGTLTNNGLVDYGNWGQGMRKYWDESISVYVNDELKIGDNLRLDAGMRYEHLKSRRDEGNELEDANGVVIQQSVPAGTGGLARTVGSTFDGTYDTDKKTWNPLAWTIGANYTITNQFSVYARVADGFQTIGIEKPVDILLYEAGARFSGYGFTALATVFQTRFNNQFYNFLDPDDPATQGRFLADLRTNGIEMQLTYQATPSLSFNAQGVLQKPRLKNVFINDVAEEDYEDNTPERTPETLITVSSTFLLPNDLGEVYASYKHIGKIYADAGNGLALPSYGVISAGIGFNVTDNLTLRVAGDNLTNEIGLTEGNPRQGQTQTVVDGYFYGRGIAGRSIIGSLSYRF